MVMNLPGGRQTDPVIERDELIQLETQVWRALQSGDAVADAAMLADDFLGGYPTGFSDRAGHADQLADGPTVAEFEIHDATMTVVTEENVLLSYRADFRRAAQDAESETMFVSSLWARRGGRWVNTFSQDTPAS